MNYLAKAIIGAVLIALICAPAATQSQNLELPVTKSNQAVTVSLQPGNHSIQYGGQTLVFDTQVQLLVRLYFVSLDRFQIAFKRHPNAPQGGGSPASEQVFLTWEEYQELMFNGTAPTDEWIGEINNSEGGWVER